MILHPLPEEREILLRTLRIDQLDTCEEPCNQWGRAVRRSEFEVLLGFHCA